MSFKASAPGSLMLLGEYAVLHGKHALVCAVDKRMTVTLKPRTDTKITITSAALGHFATDISHLAVVTPFQFILAALKKFQKQLPSGCDLLVESEFSDKIGFGSSSAVTVATLAVITAWLNQALSSQEMILLARNIIRKVQGLGSGADAAACVLGGMVAYKMQPLLAEKLPHQHALTAVYAGYKTPTVVAVQKVKASSTTYPRVYRQLFQAIDTCAQQGIQFVREQNWTALGVMMNIQQGLMESFGVSTPLLNELIHLLRADAATQGAKISGSGLGDCVVGLGEVAPLVLTDEKMKQIPVTISPHGVVCEKIDVVRHILGSHWQQAPQKVIGHAFAPTNIALCKYWGKRDQELNLPLTSSLSISLANKGASVTLTLQDAPQDTVLLNGLGVAADSSFYKKLVNYLDLFRLDTMPRLRADIQSNIPIAAGLASSACGFASLIMALDDLYDWQLGPMDLSILARLGSGSASRSIEAGFVEWQAGERDDGMDSYGIRLAETWPEFCVGLLIVSEHEKSVSSREAMQRTIETSALYSAWPAKVRHDLSTLKHAIAEKDFDQLGKAAESNATTMHATMLSAWPAILYGVPETGLAMQQVWELRRQGLSLYFTQDAGPNIKLLFEQRHIDVVKSAFPSVEIVQPFP